MTIKFGQLLDQFALSVDMVDNDTFNQLKSMLANFFLNALGVSFFEVQVDGTKVKTGIVFQNGLKTVWSNKEITMCPIFSDVDKKIYSGQTTYAYDKELPLWVVATDGGKLGRNSPPDYTDLWSGADGLPPYWDYARIEAKTSIIIPLNYGGRTFGFVNLEFTEFIEPSDHSKRELKLLIGAIARLLWLHDMKGKGDGFERKRGRIYFYANSLF